MDDYHLIDSGHFRKLEQVGPYRLIRPAAGAIWQPALSAKEWQNYDAEFIRDKNSEGTWKVRNKKLPSCWPISVSTGRTMLMKLTDFGHIGIFPEHHAGALIEASIQAHVATNKPFKLLNLFAYTGAVSLMAAAAGAEVVHVDASKTSVAWARSNAELSGLSQSKIRWIVDDVKKFVAREQRRSATYQGIILDPPSFGRGLNGEVWKIEADLLPLLAELKKLQADDFKLMQLSAHSQGYTPLALYNVLQAHFSSPSEATTAASCFTYQEMYVAGKNGQGQRLPSGAMCLYQAPARG